MRRHKDPSRRQPKPSRRKTPKQKTPQARKTTQAEDTPSPEDSPSSEDPHNPDSRQKRGGAAPDKGHCTRYVAVHPLRGDAPEQKRRIAYGSGALPQHTRKTRNWHAEPLTAATSPGASGGLIVPHRRCPTASVVQVARSDSCCAVLILTTASPTENSTPLILALTVQTTGPRHPPIPPVMPPPIPVTPPPSDVEVEAGHMTPPLICSHPHATPGTCPSNTTCPLPHTFFTRRSW